MKKRESQTNKKLAIQHWKSSKKYWMTDKEYVGIVVGRDATDSEYVITDGVIEPQGFVPNHYHKWEDQTFHVLTGDLKIIVGDRTLRVGAGATIHCPRGTPHYMENIGQTDAKIISYLFPGDWAEEFLEETSRQVKSQEMDYDLIEAAFGVVYL
ncbi:MAG: cupin domain-containing protein [Saprospiraceae bacterium]|nr:cupin domain-containing protein [Saprospiraceae bacterium]